MNTPSQIKAPAPWQELARAQHNAPAVADLVAQLSSEISQQFVRFGPSVLSRVHASVYFGVTTFPADLQARYAWGQGYLIAWVFALDDLLDNCPAYSYATDLHMLLGRLLNTPLNVPLRYQDLPLRNDPTAIVPSVGYSIIDVVTALQMLRCHLYRQATNAGGPKLFDRYLESEVIALMLHETAWRLHELPPPDFATYLRTATITICGGLCVVALNAVLPQPLVNWRAIKTAATTMCRAVRLINDLATKSKDEDEGTPNAVNLLTKSSGNAATAARAVRQLADEAAARLGGLCAPLLEQPKDSSLYVLGFYTYYSWVMTEAMYANGDFIAVLDEETDDGGNLLCIATQAGWCAVGG